jgi:hypothetical protein
LTKLVYIGGYGHSGSTLVEYLMTASPQVIACGEVASAARERMKKTRCTCGEITKDCPIWGSFVETSCRSGSWSHQNLTVALLKFVSDDYAVLVDSSKTARHSANAPFGLRRRLGHDFQLVHIVRDPRAVCWSALKKAERRGEAHSNGALHCTFTTLGWWTANLACELFGWTHPDQYVRLVYEDVVHSPRESAGTLLKMLLPESECQFETLGTGTNRHQLYGNRMRSRPPSLREIKEDEGWKTDMPGAYRRLVEALSWPLRSKYGYS